MGTFSSISIEPVNIPNGKYHGLWSAYYVEVVSDNGTQYKPFEVTKGVKGISCVCGVEVLEGVAYIYNKPFDITILKYYYIQQGYAGNMCYWWKANNQGYSCEIREARVFNEEEMTKIIDEDYQGKYIAWECSYIKNNASAKVHAIDMQYLDCTKNVSKSLSA